MRRGLRQVLAVLCVGVLLGACTSPDRPAGPAATTETPDQVAAGRAGSATAPDAAAPAAEVPGATRGGLLTVLSSTVPESLDPARSSFVDTRGILSGLLTRSLTQLRRNPVTGRMELVPDLATDLGVANDDRTAWTFTLRSGVRFENGTAVTAQDVAYGLQRAFAADVLPGAPSYLRAFFRDGDRYQGPYASAAELRRRPGYARGWYAGAAFRGVEVRGRTITFRLRRPVAEMPYVVALPQFSPVPRAADARPAAYGDRLVSTGPYRVASLRRGTTLVLVRNAQWDPATDPGRHQYADGWTFLWGQAPDRIDELLLENDGDAQRALSYDSLGPEGLVAMRERAPSRVAVAASPCTYLWHVDTRRIPDLRVRRALGWAYPYEAAWRAGRETVGATRLPGTTILPPGTTGHRSYDPLGNGGRRTDVAEARRLLTRADALGSRVRWYYASDVPEKVAVKDVVVTSLRRAGFDPRPIATTADRLRTVQLDPDGPHDVVDAARCSDWPTGSSWFPAQWETAPVGGPGRPNPSMLTEPGVQREIDRILGTLTAAAAARAWGALDERIGTRYYPAVVLGHRGVALARGSRVGGMSVNEMLGMPIFADLYVDQGN
ncbi:hypothetical protein KV100_18590 [Mumia sp. zg.B21]|uniref:ABC transporter substrate-binding protein n=1 Tax=Mumia sp. zg.B21 TaxID=2855447 RepID=UPI001C6F019E|nr:ABC transporter substrate-binding protein [Mumia sp. zg.B21]MBW9211660.1 hypothetical protein [Mumia sp. zg.B21]